MNIVSYNVWSVQGNEEEDGLERRRHFTGKKAIAPM
jgi:hypothetical protein